jgi:hypothetical protein
MTNGVLILASPARGTLQASSDHELKEKTNDPLAQWTSWINHYANWTHAATFTCKRKSKRGLPITSMIVLDTARHLTSRVNRKCFGKAARRGKSIAVIASHGWGLYGDHPHLHFIFASPSHLKFDDFSIILSKAADRTFWIDREWHIKPYRDVGWIEYLISHSTENLLIDLLPLQNA